MSQKRLVDMVLVCGIVMVGGAAGYFGFGKSAEGTSIPAIAAGVIAYLFFMRRRKHGTQ